MPTRAAWRRWASRISPPTQNVGKAETPGEWLEYSPILTVIICTLGFLYLIREVGNRAARR